VTVSSDRSKRLPSGSGLWVFDVDHDGNRNASDEEVEAVADLVAKLTAPGSEWIDEHDVARQMTGNQILVVAPYNAHVNRLDARLKDTGARVGTVDKFQGQQAPVVICSMATSRASSSRTRLR
jgi:superfamily I DNA and/or RNA helicase